MDHLVQLFTLSFKDRRGKVINKATDATEFTSTLTKMSLLRYIFIDEIEAAVGCNAGFRNCRIRMDKKGTALALLSEL